MSETIPVDIALHELNEAESLLDDLGVPRTGPAGGGALSLSGRLRWLVDHTTWREVPSREAAMTALEGLDGVFMPSINQRDRHRLASTVLGLDSGSERDG